MADGGRWQMFDVGLLKVLVPPLPFSSLLTSLYYTVDRAFSSSCDGKETNTTTAILLLIKFNTQGLLETRLS
jgi:hypothetical protein